MKRTTKDPVQPDNYEAALAELQQLVAELQDNIVSIDDLTAKVQRAEFLAEWCKIRLRDTEAAVNTAVL